MTSDATLASALHPWLRLRVAALRGSTLRRVFPASVEVVDVPPLPGCVDPRAGVSSWQHDGDVLDRGLRVDLIARLAAGRATRIAVVVVRPGHHLEGTAEDAQWCGAAQQAAGHLDKQLAAVVLLSRWGWLDRLSGEHREWRRLRVRKSAAIS
jgi:hypothetical protein